MNTYILTCKELNCMTRLENITKYMMALLTALIVSTLYAPIVLTIFFSFYKTRKGQVNWESFSYEPYTKLIFEKGVSKISIIGVGMITTPGVTFRMFQTLANKKINIKVISTSEIKISVLIDKKNTKKALIALHKEFKLDIKR